MEQATTLGFGRVSRTSVQRLRLAHRKQGLCRLLDHRTTRASSPTGRADERVAAAVREALRRRRGRSRGTINGLFPLITQILEDRHDPGTVPAPSQATLYRLVTALARPGELPTGPVRQVPASVDGRAFTPATALRPGKQVQADTTRLDVLALFDDGRLNHRPARSSLIVTGPAAARKTTALLNVGRPCHLAHTRTNPEPRGSAHTGAPIAYVPVPPGATAKTLVTEFARYLGRPVATRMNQTQITDAVCHTSPPPTSSSSSSPSSTASTPPHHRRLDRRPPERPHRTSPRHVRVRRHQRLRHTPLQRNTGRPSASTTRNH
ncbi:hypothetical protein ACIP4Y_37625 [Streptomyces sp. NPDC088810]|uniref:hypothetical protein n=1 Tax=Streptomyces sp. NPDC088810 TaxID=3365904 RepID=UPI00381D3F3F